MCDREVVACVLRHETDVLLIRHGDTGLWGLPTGTRDEATEAGAKAVLDDLGVADSAVLVRTAEPLVVGDGSSATGRRVYPVLFDCETTAVETDEQPVEFEWVQPPEVLGREAVDWLWNAYVAVAPTVETVRTDGDHGSAYVSLRALEVLRDRAAAATHDGSTYETLAGLARELRDTRPNMAVVANRINRVMATADRTVEGVEARATETCERAVLADEAAAERASALVGGSVLTLSRSGTVLGVLRRAAPDRVYIAESRPAREGVGVAETLADSMDVTLCVDAVVGHVLAAEPVDTVLVGADAVSRDGVVVNKVGTRLAALAAGEHERVDCYAVCARDKVAPKPGTDADLGFEPGDTVYDGDADVDVLNPTFETVPGELFDGIVTETGVCSETDIERIAAQHAERTGWDR